MEIRAETNPPIPHCPSFAFILKILGNISDPCPAGTISPIVFIKAKYNYLCFLWAWVIASNFSLILGLPLIEAISIWRENTFLVWMTRFLMVRTKVANKAMNQLVEPFFASDLVSYERTLILERMARLSKIQ